ncbi:hypothetical protein C8R45DRAFT_944005 [Mycena sanguinolenta]|nr:hypothetical protein C8R45DRAFT_944005 [Mycena sanguinolenta]
MSVSGQAPHGSNLAIFEADFYAPRGGKDTVFEERFDTGQGQFEPRDLRNLEAMRDGLTDKLIMTRMDTRAPKASHRLELENNVEGAEMFAPRSVNETKGKWHEAPTSTHAPEFGGRRNVNETGELLRRISWDRASFRRPLYTGMLTGNENHDIEKRTTKTQSLEAYNEIKEVAWLRKSPDESTEEEGRDDAPSPANPGKREVSVLENESEETTQSIYQEMTALIKTWVCIWRLISGCALLWLTMRVRKFLKILEEIEDKKETLIDPAPPTPNPPSETFLHHSKLDTSPSPELRFPESPDTMRKFNKPSKLSWREYNPASKGKSRTKPPSSVAYAAADKLIAQVSSERPTFGAPDSTCFGRIHDKVHDVANEQRDAHIAGHPLRERPASLTTNQAAYLGSFSAPTGEEVHRAVFLNAEMQVYNPSTGEMGSLPGHAYTQLHTKSTDGSGRGPPIVPHIGPTHTERLDTQTPMPGKLRLPDDLQDDTVLRFTVDTDPDLSMMLPYPTLATHPAVIEDTLRSVNSLEYWSYSDCSDLYKIQYGANMERTQERIQDPHRARPDTPTPNLPLVLYHGPPVSLLPSIIEEGEISEADVCIDPQYVCIVGNAQAEETNQSIRRTLRKARSEGALERQAITDVQTDRGEISESRCGSAPALLPDSLASTPHADRFPYHHNDFDDDGYVVVPTPQHAYKPGWTPAQILEEAISAAAHTPATPMSHLIRATSVISAASDSDEPPPLVYPGSSSSSSDDWFSPIPFSPAHDTRTRFPSNSYGFMDTSAGEIAQVICSTSHRYAPDVLDPNLHAKHEYELHLMMEDIYAGRINSRREKDHAMANIIYGVLHAFDLDAEGIVDRNSPDKDTLLTPEEWLARRAEEYARQGQELTQQKFSIYFDDQAVWVNNKYPCNITEERLNRVSTYLGGGVRRVSTHMEPPLTYPGQYPVFFSDPSREFGAANLIALGSEYLGRYIEVGVLTSARSQIRTFLACTFDGIGERGMQMQWEDVNRPTYALQAYLTPMDNLKLRLIHHTYKSHGNHMISDATEALMKIRFKNEQVYTQFSFARLLDAAAGYPATRNESIDTYREDPINVEHRAAPSGRMNILPRHPDTITTWTPAMRALDTAAALHRPQGFEVRPNPLRRVATTDVAEARVVLREGIKPARPIRHTHTNSVFSRSRTPPTISILDIHQ